MLAGCASGAGDETDAGISVVASTSVYGQIAEAIGGDLIEATSIVTSDAQDPHSFEASARDQLAVSRADLIIENGGGYDAFMDDLIDASGSEAPVLTAVEFSTEWPGEAASDSNGDHDHAGHDHIEGFNEHVWYDVEAMGMLAHGIRSKLEVLSPENEDAFAANLDDFLQGITGLEDALAGVAADHAGAQVFVTEPVPGYLIDAAGLENVTPDAFTEAVEEGQDVAPATLLESLDLLNGGDVRVVITNTQTSGAESERIADEAQSRGIPVISFSETLPQGQTYLSWMQANIDALATALGG